MDVVAANQGFGHEQVVMRHDQASGLTAIIAIHSTHLGPAAGGCRRWRYVSMEAALTDALRLSEGMSLKNALAGIPFGGGKSVILADGRDAPSARQLAVFGGWLNELGGRYVTAEDVGMGVAAIGALSAHTEHVSGLGKHGVGGDPSPHTAHGVFLGLKAAVAHRLGATSLKGVRVAVQGLGAVGMSLCQLLDKAGAKLYVADLDAERMRVAVNAFDATPVAAGAIALADVDVFAPCALGGVITEEVAMKLRAQVVAGAANNQLATPAAGVCLAERGVLYAPDFVINAGGVISVMHEYLSQRGGFASTETDDGEHSVARWVGSRIQAIPGRMLDIVRAAEATGESADVVARRAAQRVMSRQAKAEIAA